MCSIPLNYRTNNLRNVHKFPNIPESKAKFRKLGHYLPQHNVTIGGQDSQTRQTVRNIQFSYSNKTHTNTARVNVPLLHDGAVICDP